MCFDTHSGKNAELPRAVSIAEVRDEDCSREPQLRTFFFDLDLDVRPGQFVQLWLPGVDEKPFSVSYAAADRIGVTVARVGPFTTRLFECKPGDQVGLRGPYGNGFDLAGARRIAIVNGGCGCAPTAPLAEQAHRAGLDVAYIMGARTGDLLIFQDRMKALGVRTLVCTDDGSVGPRALPTDLLAELFVGQTVDLVFGCGPEPMLKATFDLCQHHGKPCQLSLERYMKCAIGVCGACALDGTGWLVCRDGPVFTGEQLALVTEFGRYQRDASGAKVALACSPNSPASIFRVPTGDCDDCV